MDLLTDQKEKKGNIKMNESQYGVYVGSKASMKRSNMMHFPLMQCYTKYYLQWKIQHSTLQMEKITHAKTFKKKMTHLLVVNVNECQSHMLSQEGL